jgi:hypothetical protein
MRRIITILIIVMAVALTVGLVLVWFCITATDQFKASLSGTLATVLVAFITCITAWTALQTVEEMKRAREAQEQPEIIVDFDAISHPPFIQLVVHNIGNGAARYVKFSFEPELIASNGRNYSKSVTFLKEGIPFMPPNRKLTQLFDRIPDLLESKKPLAFDVTLSFEDVRGNVYSRVIPLDLKVYIGHAEIRPKGIYEVVQQLEKLNQRINQLASIATQPGIKGILVRTPEDARREIEQMLHKSEGKEDN